MQRLSGLDAGFLHIESPRVFAYLGSAVILDPSTSPTGRLDLETLTELVSERLHLIPPFRRRLVEVPLGLGLPYWIEDPDFDLDFHLRESAIPAPGTHEQFAHMVARTFGRPMDRSRPLWELWLVQGLPDGQVALLTKFHHAMTDGVGGNEILGVLVDESPAGRVVEPPNTVWRAERRPSDVELLAMGLSGLARDTVKAARAMPRMLPQLPSLLGTAGDMSSFTQRLTRVRTERARDREVLESTSRRAPATPFNGPVSAHRRWTSGTVPLDLCKSIKSRAGVTINDVVVTVCARALRNYLIAHDALPDDPLVAAIPVSVRATDANGKGIEGNRIGMMMAPIGTNVADPLERLEHTAAALRSAKERHGALPADMMTDLANFVPPAIAARATRTALNVMSRTRSPVNVLISNVPGPRQSLYCAGAEMQAYYPVPPIMDGVGVNITVVSYRDELQVGIIADRDQVDDVQFLLDSFVEGLHELDALL